MVMVKDEVRGKDVVNAESEVWRKRRSRRGRLQ